MKELLMLRGAIDELIGRYERLRDTNGDPSHWTRQHVDLLDAAGYALSELRVGMHDYLFAHERRLLKGTRVGWSN